MDGDVFDHFEKCPSAPPAKCYVLPRYPIVHSPSSFLLSRRCRHRLRVPLLESTDSPPLNDPDPETYGPGTDLMFLTEADHTESIDSGLRVDGADPKCRWFIYVYMKMMNLHVLRTS